MNPKKDLMTAINDIKNIRIGYDAKEEERSPLLSEKLTRLEMKLLDQFFELMNKPVVKKSTGKKKNKVMSEKPSGPQQIRT